MSTLRHSCCAVSHPQASYPDLSSQPVVVTVEPLRPGVWLVRSSDDRFGGTFLCPKVALKFAREEASALPNAVMVVSSGDIPVRPQPADRVLLMAAREGLKPAA